MPVKSDKLGPGVLTFGETASASEWAGQLTKCLVEPKTETEDSIPTLSGEEVEGDTTDSAELSGTILQSYDMDSLLLWAHEHHGEVMPFKFVPNAGAALQVTGRVQIQRLSIGGDVKTRNTSDFTYTIIGNYELGELV